MFYLINMQLAVMERIRPVERGGKGGKFSRAPRCLGGPAVAKKYWKWCSRWLLSDL